LCVSPLAHELNWILLLPYKFILCKYDIRNARFVGLEVCIGSMHWVLPGTPCKIVV
jgi:hypothetical protein